MVMVYKENDDEKIVYTYYHNSNNYCTTHSM